MILPDWFIRLALAIGILLLGWVLFRVYNKGILYRVRKLGSNPRETRSAELPTIVYFTTPDCVACKTTQRPALNRLMEKLESRLQVIEINAYENPEKAVQWGVLSVPTTFILDTQGLPVQVNHGVTPAEKLLQQIRSIYPVVNPGSSKANS